MLLSFLLANAQIREEIKFENGIVAYMVKDGEYWGVENSAGATIVPKIYRKLSYFGNIICGYERKDTKDKNATTIYDFHGSIKVPETEGLSFVEFKYLNGQCIISAELKGKNMIGCVLDENGDFLYLYKQYFDSDGFIYLKNEIADTIVVEPGQFHTYSFKLEGDVIIGSVMHRKCAMNLDGSFIIPPILYESITPYGFNKRTEGFIVRTSGGGSTPKGFAGFYDRNGKCIIQANRFVDVWPQNNGSFEVKKDGKAGIADSRGNLMFMTKYRDINAFKKNGEWYLETSLGPGERGIMNLNGKIIKEPKPVNHRFEFKSFDLNYIKIQNNGLYGLLGDSNHKLLQCEYDYIYTQTDIPGFRLEKNGYTGFAMPNGKIIISCDRYNNIESIKDEANLRSDYEYFKVELNGKYGLCDINGCEIIRPLYDDILIRKKKIVANVGIYEGILDFQGNIIIPFMYSSIKPFKDDIYSVNLHGKCGLCEKGGKIIIPPLYTSISHVEGMLAGPYKEIYRVQDGLTEGIYTLDGHLIFPASLYKDVTIHKRNLLETRFNVDWYIEAKNDRDDILYYDLNGKLLYESHNNIMFEDYSRQGDQEFNIGNYKKAIEKYNKALEIRQESYTFYKIGQALYAQGKYKDAIKRLNECISLSKSQYIKNVASDLIIDCERCQKQKRQRRANLWLGILGSFVDVATTVVLTNEVIHNWNSNNGFTSEKKSIIRDKNLDYLLDPRFAAMQVQQQNWNEYLQMTNGGTTMSYEEWYAIKAQAWAESQKSESDNFTNTSISSSSNSSYSNNKTVSGGKNCRQCAGTGNCKTCTGRGWYYNPLDLRKQVLCPNCHNHDGKCTFCGGKGSN